MCGVCTEQIALNNLCDEMHGNLQMKYLGSILDRYFYLRETPDFLTAFDKVKRSLAQKRLPFFSEVPHDVVLYRGLEILLEHGFSSAQYQQLLKKQLYREAIVATCSEENRKAFVAATEGLDIELLGLLYDAETYFWGERSKELRTLANVLSACRNLLKHYISWWLDGKGLQKEDEYCISSDEHSRFYLLCRAIYFSILMVGSCSAGKKMLGAIAGKDLMGIPGAFGEDLWLNRVAALKLFDLEGFDLYLKRLSVYKSHRHYFYIDQMRGFTEEQKHMLLDEVNRHIEIDYAENAGSLRLYSWVKDPHWPFEDY